MRKNSPILFFLILTIFFSGINALFQAYIYGHENYNILLLKGLKYKRHFNYTFWLSSFGIGLKVIIDIIITCFLCKISAIAFMYKMHFRETLYIVCTAYLSFFAQMCTEFFYINYVGIKNIHAENLSILSLSFFFDLIEIEIPFYLKYLSETINVFEIIFILLLIYLSKKVINISYNKAVKLILASYVLPLIIWLLMVTLITLINSGS